MRDVSATRYGNCSCAMHWFSDLLCELVLYNKPTSVRCCSSDQTREQGIEILLGIENLERFGQNIFVQCTKGAPTLTMA